LRSEFFSDQFAKGMRERDNDHEHWLRESTTKLLTNKRATVMIIANANADIGYCYSLTRLSPNLEAPKVSSVEEFLIVESARGQAAASTLFDAVKADFLARGADRVQLRVLQSNIEGSRFWSSQGFEPYLVLFELPKNLLSGKSHT
jgi:ribosomal protein S18 acetylase RimI-like enzyme